MKSRLCIGEVRHRRLAPRAHAFRYGVFQLYLDLAELDTVFAGRWLWSARRPAPAWFRRADHLGDPARPLDESVRELVAAETGACPAGPVRLLTNLRYLGYCFNPVSFYYCFDAADERLDFVVAEVNNTPWGERHCYVLDCRDGAPGGQHAFSFGKAFHISPFMAMEQTHHWRFSTPGERVQVHMENHEANGRLFTASLSLEARPITGASLAGALARHPFMTGKVIAAIYWQALRLWLKRVPFHAHPRHHETQEVSR